MVKLGQFELCQVESQNLALEVSDTRMADREAEEPNVQYMEEVETTHVVQEIVLPDHGQLEATSQLGPNMVIQDGRHQQLPDVTDTRK